MQEKTTSNPNDSSLPARESQAPAFFLATFFLVAPIILLLVFTVREQPAAREDSISAGDYLSAVREASQPELAPVSNALVSVDLNHPVKVVTWTRRERVPDYKSKTTPANKDTWVTVDPYLRIFCREYVKSHGADPGDLSRRLQQRLGLPPDSMNDTFVELTVNPKDVSQLFRPCSDPSPTPKTCGPAIARTPAELKSDLNDPKKKQELQNRYWFLNNYYSSFASKYQYPWTSLGYTFDWAPTDVGDDVIRFGESEFIVPAGAPIQFVSAEDTVAYCAAH